MLVRSRLVVAFGRPESTVSVEVLFLNNCGTILLSPAAVPSDAGEFRSAPSDLTSVSCDVCCAHLRELVFE